MWSKAQIRQARKTQLVPILLERSYRLYPLVGGNYRILPDPDDPDAPTGLIVKQSFWIWPERDMAGNTIDFFVKVEGLSFHQAMQIVAAHIGAAGKQEVEEQEMPIPVVSTTQDYDHDGNKTRRQCGNQPEILR